jgi:hypothetical protein
VHAADVSDTALAYTALNAKRLSVSEHVTPVNSSWCSALGHLEGKCGGVVSNPPYIPHDKLSSLQPEVARCAVCYLMHDLPCCCTAKDSYFGAVLHRGWGCALSNSMLGGSVNGSYVLRCGDMLQ